MHRETISGQDRKNHDSHRRDRMTRFSPLDVLLLSPDFRGLVLLIAHKYWRKSKKSSGEPPVETAPRNCRFLSLVVVELVLKFFDIFYGRLEISGCTVFSLFF